MPKFPSRQRNPARNLSGACPTSRRLNRAARSTASKTFATGCGAETSTASLLWKSSPESVAKDISKKMRCLLPRLRLKFYSLRKDFCEVPPSRCKPLKLRRPPCPFLYLLEPKLMVANCIFLSSRLPSKKKFLQSAKVSHNPPRPNKSACLWTAKVRDDFFQPSANLYQQFCRPCKIAPPSLPWLQYKSFAPPPASKVPSREFYLDRVQGA